MNMNFDSLGLIPPILKNIHESGYETPTPIQSATIPLVLSGKDVLGCAQTGTGKTAAFALPILQLLHEHAPRVNAKVIRSLILSPTRELAMQTYENFQLYGKGLGLETAVIFGGVGQGGQVEALHRGADIVVACPGRLLDLMGQGLVRLDWVEIFVLDEADRMLDMGFIHDVRKIVRCLPDERQTLLFSATMPPEVEKLALDLLVDPENVKVDPVTSTVEAIDQCLYYVDKVNKKHLLAQLLSDPEVESALVFSRTKHGVDRIVRDLKRKSIEAAGIHGDKSQNARQTALNRFKSGECRVLVATHIAARGIDVAASITICPWNLRPISTASAAPAVPAGRAKQFRSAASMRSNSSTRWKSSSANVCGKRRATGPWRSPPPRLRRSVNHGPQNSHAAGKQFLFALRGQARLRPQRVHSRPAVRSRAAHSKPAHSRNAAPHPDSKAAGPAARAPAVRSAGSTGGSIIRNN